ncbi:putative polyketide synthase [Truncatella angustata]|uniref:Polyketide synthase n=1 Tax=Truncatella angustata TaxID=152316 RepID=A0A9P8ZWH8_9PEZI|nr:putative polyketide synthase [Truncatella angustata]KAH6652982.1 putative polyketide synthase [Truncatella angustata]
MSEIVPIAIIGLGCRLPGGANSPEQLWDMLYEGRSGQRPVPSTRWNAEAFYHPDQNAKESLNFRSGYFIDQDISAFDARFFGIPPREANGMDPQQRLLLETTYEALENAGISLSSLKGSDTAVYVAEFTRDYDRMANKDIPQLHLLHVTGKGDAILSNRISYLLDLKGPSLTIDTGCSGSMVALHQACQSIRLGESKLAIVGGAQLLLHPDQSMAMNQIGMMNADGKCYVFDDRGSGYARGEGVGAVILKRYDDAINDGDAIHAVIAHSGVNQDGRTLGIHLPNADAQAALAESVYAAAGLDPAETLYVEAHGTNVERSTNLLVGSIKSNIGHLESVSGIAALIKSIMILKRDTIPANLNFVTPKAALQLDKRPISIPTNVTPLATPDYSGPRRISLNGFGYGGTNAHIILEPATKNKAVTNMTNGTGANGDQAGHAMMKIDDINGISHKHAEAEADPQIFVLSAASESSLRHWAARLKQWLSTEKCENAHLQDLSHTLALRRSLHTWRSGIVASSATDLINQLTHIKPVKSSDASSVQVAFVFTGQGAQWHGMGRELLLIPGPFRNSIARSAGLLQEWGAGWALDVELVRGPVNSRLGESQLAQPATTAIQIAMVDLLVSCGVVPQRVCGHSSGEIAAAYAAGALSHEAALKISYIRGVISAKAKKLNQCRGSMLAAGLGEDEIAPHIAKTTRGKLVIACINSAESTTISGDEEAIDELVEILNDLGVFNRKLKVDTAYHSHHMMAVADTYLSSLEGVEFGTARTDTVFYSTVANTATIETYSPAYWTQNLVSPVQFQKGLNDAAKDMASCGSQGSTASVFIEIGPHSALLGPSRQILSKVLDGTFKYSYVAPMIRNKNAIQTTLDSIRQLFEVGCPLRLEGVISLTHTATTGNRVVHDLPPYSWDHSTTYWHESRLSREHRLRHFPYHDLLGLLDVVGGDLARPKWRYHIGIGSLPWLRDHVVDGFIIFPGSGYICMAIEAMKQIVQVRKVPGTVKRYSLRDITFSKSIIVPEPRADGEKQEIELQITFNPTSTSGNQGTWEVFSVVSYNATEASWAQHCCGLISAEMELDAQQLEVDNEQLAADGVLIRKLEEAQTFTTHLSVDEVYDDLTSTGNVYGPTFRGLEEVKIQDCQAFAKSRIQDVSKSMPSSYMQPHLIHPTTLDFLEHVTVILFKRQCANSPVMPVFIGELSISVDLTNEPGAELFSTSRIDPEGPGSATLDTWVFQETKEGPQLVLSMCNWQLLAVGEAQKPDVEIPFQRNMAFKMDWQVDVDQMIQQDFHNRVADAQLFGVGFCEGMSASQTVVANEKAAMIYIRDALYEIQKGDVEVTIPHLRHLYAWMQRHCTKENQDHVLGQVSPSEETAALKRSKDSGAQGEMLARIGLLLPEILAGTTDALPVMLQDDLLSKFYSEGLITSSYLQMTEFAKLLAFKQPQMSVLEIGAGTGGATMPLLQALEDPVAGLLFKEYCYTDISAGFFEQARSKFKHWEHRMSFQTLDISQDPLHQQGFADAKFDLILASNVLHATPSLDDTTTNVRKLLKPGGRLILIELTNVHAFVNMIFGTLPGWWLSGNGLKDSPLLTAPEWDTMLRRHSFNGLDIATPDHEEETSVATMMVSKAVETTHRNDITIHPVTVTVLVTRPTAISASLSISVVQMLKRQGLRCNIETITATKVKYGGSYIVLDSADQAFLKDPSREEFEAFKSLLAQSKTVLWASFQESDSFETCSIKGMITGIARVVRSENDGINLVTVDIRDRVSSDSLDRLSLALSNLVTATFWQQENANSLCEREYAIANRDVIIPRLSVDSMFNNWASSTTANTSLTDMYPYKDMTRPLKLEAETPGLLNSIRFVDDFRLSTPLPPDEIQLEAYAHGINFKDVFVALGQMPPRVHMVGEVAGVVTAVGSEMRHLYKVGDRVSGMHSEPFANCARLKGLHACIIPSNLDFVQAASVAAVYLTAWHCLNRAAHLQEGQSILIHAASGGVGQAAIQLAQLVGAEIFATVGSAAKRDLIVERYSIPETHIFSTRSTTFKSGIMRLTGGRGVDVVLNSLSGEQLAASWEAVADFGTFVEIGKSDIYRRNQISMTQFDKCASFIPVDLSLLANKRPNVVHSGLKAMFSLFEKGLVSPVTPVTKIPMGQIEGAFRLIASRKHTGKLVAFADDNTLVKAVVSPPKQLILDHRGTYVVVGGLGDLGQRICRLLARCGAGHIVTLSRSILPDEALQALQNELSEIGAILYPVQCDISDSTSVEKAAEFCKSKLPPVKGVVHGGMVLDDHPLEVMKWEEYNGPIRPKVYGTLNVHNAFTSVALEFFISLSSSAGVLGTTGQANYAAGNTFQDAFAHAQNSKPGNRTRYVALDLGAIGGSNAITRLAARGEELKRQGLLIMTFEELYKGLEYAMGPWAVKNDCGQIILGFDGKSLSHIDGGANLHNPLFQRLLLQNMGANDARNGVVSDSLGADPAKLLENVKTLQEGEDIILKATAEKFSVFLDSDVPTDIPIAKLALDSLVSIELKNWMVRTFRAPLQASELAGALSIAALSKLLASRSECLKSEIRSGSNKDTSISEEAQQKATNSLLQTGKYQSDSTEKLPSHGWECCRHTEKLAKYPLLGLDEAVNLLIDNMGHMLGPEDFQILKDAAEDLRRPKGPARQAYAQLVDMYNDSNLDNWMYDLITDAGYLKQRSPVAPYSSVVGTHHDSPFPHTQSERAAVVTLAAFNFRNEVVEEEVEPYWNHSMPSCTWQWKWLFNAYRLPGAEKDSMIRHEGIDCIAVLRRGHVFKVPLRDDGVAISYAKLKATFEAIIDHSEVQELWTGILTTDLRGSWAKIREQVLDISAHNKEYLQVIEEAIFVVCLDDASPETNEQHVRQAYLGTGFNRWMDKSTQFIVMANGKSSFILEHGAIDGITANRLSERVHKHIQEHSPGLPNGQISHPAQDIKLQKQEFQSTSKIDEHIEKLRERYTSTAQRIGYKRHTLTTFGIDKLMSNAVPVKSVVDATVQLAIRLHYGHNTQCWESVSMAHYHKGRTDMMQIANREVNDFCAMALDETVPLSELRAKLLELGHSMSTNMQRCQSNGTYLRLFELLKVLWPKDAPKAEMFSKNLYWRKPYVISNHGPVNSPVCDSVWGIQEPQSVWIMTTSGSESIEFSIAGGPIEAFAKRLDEASLIINKIIQAR